MITETFKELDQLGYKCLPVKDKIAFTPWKEGVTELNKYAEGNGIAIVCGYDGLECWDFDNHFGDARENLATFLKEIKPLNDKYKFPIEKTVSGGFHLLIRCNDVEGSKKLASRLKISQDGKEVPDAIIETRGKGGYFVCSPSKGYEMKVGSFKEVPRIAPEERKQLIEAAKLQNTWHKLNRQAEETENRPGDRYNQSIEAKEEMIKALEKAGWQDLGNKKWRRPEKEEGISATLGHVAEDIFYCFTSNGHPFEPNRAYTPFQVVTLLEYNGDFKAFTAELAKRYGLSKPQRKQFGQVTERTFSESELETMFKDSWVNLDIEQEEPTPAIKVFNSAFMPSEQRMFTLGNFSVIQGKQKAKKSFLASMITAAAVSNSEIEGQFFGCLPEGKRTVLYFDTEQALSDTHKVGRRIRELSKTPINFEPFCLRSKTPDERKQIIDYSIKRYNGSIGLILIDGIVDLCKRNDEDEAKEISTLLMKWTEEFNCHIITVIHENKQDGFATGHVGSEVMKKAEAVISVQKDEVDPAISKVECKLIRGVGHFEDFFIRINSRGLPEVERIFKPRKLETMTYEDKLNKQK